MAGNLCNEQYCSHWQDMECLKCWNLDIQIIRKVIWFGELPNGKSIALSPHLKYVSKLSTLMFHFLTTLEFLVRIFSTISIYFHLSEWWTLKIGGYPATFSYNAFACIFNVQSRLYVEINPLFITSVYLLHYSHISVWW